MRWQDCIGQVLQNMQKTFTLYALLKFFVKFSSGGFFGGQVSIGLLYIQTGTALITPPPFCRLFALFFPTSFNVSVLEV